MVLTLSVTDSRMMLVEFPCILVNKLLNVHQIDIDCFNCQKLLSDIFLKSYSAISCVSVTDCIQHGKRNCLRLDVTSYSTVQGHREGILHMQNSQCVVCIRNVRERLQR